MRSFEHLRQKAIVLRTEHNLALDDIAQRLNVSRSTVYYWVKGIPITWTNRQSIAQQAGTAAMQAKYAARRQEAYDSAYEVAEELLADRDIRDFVVLYLAEGTRKDRNAIGFSNSNPEMIRFANECIRRLSPNPHILYSFQYHADQDSDELRAFWAGCLGIEPKTVAAIPKTNSGHLKGRRFACQYGIFQVRVNDTYLRARLQALMDVVQQQWSDCRGF
ncbi:MAG: helix-turn-helix domain-containing protein [Chloroflexia bacterium]|jgi:transcriptional regulator with XRE-family HTH domain